MDPAAEASSYPQWSLTVDTWQPPPTTDRCDKDLETCISNSGTQLLQRLLTRMFLWRLGNPAKLELTRCYEFGERRFTHELSRSKNLPRFQGTKDGDKGAIETYR